MPYRRSATKAKVDCAGTALRRNTRKLGPWHRGVAPLLEHRPVHGQKREVPSSEYPAWIVSPPPRSARIPSPALNLLKYTATGRLFTEERHSRRDCAHTMGAIPPAP